MAAHEPNPAREARTGAITIAATLATATLMAVLSRVSWHQPRIYRVGFRVNQDATDVRPGTPITLGGIEWGKVTRVEHGAVPASGDRDLAADAARRGITRGTLVTFELDPRIQLMPGARLTRAATLLGGGVELVISDTGLTRGTMEVLPLRGRDSLSDETVLSASSPPDGMIVMLGARTWGRAKSIPETFSKLRASVSADVLGTGEDGKPTGQPSWESRVDSIRASWDRLMALLDDGTPDRPTLTSDFKAIDTRLRPAWRDASDGLEELSNKLGDEWRNRGERLWRQAKGEWDRMQVLWEQSKRAGSDSMDAYHDAMANASLSGGQVRMALDEPVRLLLRLMFGKPGADGRARMARYEAASRLAIATADLREANDAMEWLANATKPADPATAAEIRAQAARAVAQFRDAIARLVQLSQQP